MNYPDPNPIRDSVHGEHQLLFWPRHCAPYLHQQEKDSEGLLWGWSYEFDHKVDECHVVAFCIFSIFVSSLTHINNVEFLRSLGVRHGSQVFL